MPCSFPFVIVCVSSIQVSIMQTLHANSAWLQLHPGFWQAFYCSSCSLIERSELNTVWLWIWYIQQLYFNDSNKSRYYKCKKEACFLLKQTVWVQKCAAVWGSIFGLVRAVGWWITAQISAPATNTARSSKVAGTHTPELQTVFEGICRNYYTHLFSVFAHELFITNQ